MGYNDDVQSQPAMTARYEPRRGVLWVIQELLAICVRLLGMAVLVVGVWAAILVIREAWALYENPERIERVAVAIDDGSNLDRLLAPGGVFLPAEDATTAAPAASDNDSTENATAQRPSANGNNALRLSYFVAWGVASLMLLIIGMLAMSAIATGGRLALYDLQLRKLTREIIREARQPGGRA